MALSYVLWLCRFPMALSHVMGAHIHGQVCLSGYHRHLAGRCRVAYVATRGVKSVNFWEPLREAEIRRGPHLNALGCGVRVSVLGIREWLYIGNSKVG